MTGATANVLGYQEAIAPLVASKKKLDTRVKEQIFKFRDQFDIDDATHLAVMAEFGWTAKVRCMRLKCC